VEAIDQTLQNAAGKFVLVVEGPVPTKENGDFCTFGLGSGTKKLMGNTVPNDKPIAEWIKQLAPKLQPSSPTGTALPSEHTGSQRVCHRHDPRAKVHLEPGGKMPPVVNVGGCPSHPDWFVGTVLEALLFLSGKGKLNLNSNNMSKTFFGQLIHENCERRASFDSACSSKTGTRPIRT